MQRILPEASGKSSIYGWMLCSIIGHRWEYTQLIQIPYPAGYPRNSGVSCRRECARCHEMEEAPGFRSNLQGRWLMKIYRRNVFLALPAGKPAKEDE